ncbi:hypothetical protein JCM31598_04770 [Desulfonatronum parangueonense]
MPQKQGTALFLFRDQNVRRKVKGEEDKDKSCAGMTDLSATQYMPLTSGLEYGQARDVLAVFRIAFCAKRNPAFSERVPTRD